VVSDGQSRVMEALEQKTEKSRQLHENLVDAVSHSFIDKRKEFNKDAKLPTFFKG
jgi:hypothetical protein